MGFLDGRRRGTFSRYGARRGAVTAAAAAATKQQTQSLQRLHQKWQTQAFGYYSKLGECWNPAQFYARSMAKLSVFMGEVDPKTGEIKPTEDPKIIGLFEPIQQAASGEGGLLASYGRLKFLIGEGRQIQYRLPEELDPDSAQKPPIWEFLSPTELAVREEGRYVVRTAQGSGEGVQYENISDEEGAGDPEPGQMRMWRFWRKHPEYSEQADSPVRAVLDLYEQLWWVTMGERADIQNRIANAGIVLVPREIDLEVSEAEIEALGEDPDADPFMVRIAGLMMAAIGDPGSAGAAVPGVIRAPAEFLHPDVFRHLTFHDPQSSVFATQREDALIRRIGLGLDLPLEEITGLSQANHWTAWKIDDEKWAHVQPPSQSWCDDVFNAIMRPLMLANGIADPDRYPVMYDNTDLVTDPDKGKTAIQLHKDGVLSAETTLEVNGFDPEDDLMTGDEKEEWLAIQMRSLELLGVTPAADPNAQPAPADQQDPPAEPAPEEEPQTEEDQGDGPPLLPSARQAATVRGIAEFALDRAREMAGAKVRSYRRSCPECFEGFEDVPNRDLVAALGRERIKRIGCASPNALVSGITSSFLITCERLGVKVSGDLAEGIELHAAQWLFAPEPPPLPEELLRDLVRA